MATLATLFLVRPSSRFLQVTRKCLNEFEFQPDPTTDYGIICTKASENLNNDLVAPLMHSFLIESSHSCR